MGGAAVVAAPVFILSVVYLLITKTGVYGGNKHGIWDALFDFVAPSINRLSVQGLYCVIIRRSVLANNAPIHCAPLDKCANIIA